MTKKAKIKTGRFHAVINIWWNSSEVVWSWSWSLSDCRNFCQKFLHAPQILFKSDKNCKKSALKSTLKLIEISEVWQKFLSKNLYWIYIFCHFRFYGCLSNRTKIRRNSKKIIFEEKSTFWKKSIFPQK